MRAPDDCWWPPLVSCLCLAWLVRRRLLWQYGAIGFMSGMAPGVGMSPAMGMGMALQWQWLLEWPLDTTNGRCGRYAGLVTPSPSFMMAVLTAAAAAATAACNTVHGPPSSVSAVGAGAAAEPESRKELLQMCMARGFLQNSPHTMCEYISLWRLGGAMQPPMRPQGPQIGDWFNATVVGYTKDDRVLVLTIALPEELRPLFNGTDNPMPHVLVATKHIDAQNTNHARTLLRTIGQQELPMMQFKGMLGKRGADGSNLMIKRE